MILAAAYTLISLVVIVACLRVLRLPPFTRPALHAAPRHRGHADVWDDGEIDEPDPDEDTAWHYAQWAARAVAPRSTGTSWLAAPVSQEAIDERDGYLERGLGLPGERQGEYGAETSRTCCASFPDGPHLAGCLPDEQWAPLLRRHLDAADAPPVTEREHRALAQRIREAQTQPLRVLPETPAYQPPPVDRKPRVAARRQAADRSAGQTGPRMMPLNGRDERDFPHLAPAQWDATGSFAAYCEVEVAHG